MADMKLADLTAGTAEGTDIVYAVKDPSGTPLDRKVTLSSVKDYFVGAANLFTTAQTIHPLSDVSALTIRRFDANSTANILAVQDQSNNLLASISSSGKVTGNSLSLSGNISSAAWTTNGIRYANVAATLTDTTSTGTVATAYTNVYGGNTIAASNSTTFTNYYNTFIAAPVSGTNVTFTNAWALGLGGRLAVGSSSTTNIVGGTHQIISAGSIDDNFNGIYVKNDSNTSYATAQVVVQAGGSSGAAGSFGAYAPTFNYRIYPPSGLAHVTNSSGGVALICNNAAGDIKFATGGDLVANERLRIKSAGDILITSASTLGWNSSTLNTGSQDVFLTRRGPANLRLGAADAAAPVAQILSVQSVVAGTSNTAGSNFTITGSQGTGTGAGGSIIFQTAAAGSSGTSQNALADALTLNSAKLATFGGNINMPSTFAIQANGTTVLDYGITTANCLSYQDTRATFQLLNGLSGGAGFGPVLGFYRSRNTVASPTNVQNGDSLGQFFSYAYSGSSYSTCSGITFEVDGTFTSGQRPPSRIIFSTSVANGSVTEALRITSAQALQVASASPFGWSTDLTLYRDNADILAQYRTTNAQTYRIYNTWTSSTNYERGKLEWSGSVFNIGTEKGSGGGTARSMAFQTDGTTRLILDTNGMLDFGGSTSSFPALKRSSTILQTRLADDSDYAPIEASTVRVAKAYTVATLPAAGTAGRMAYVTDATAPTYLGALTGGGAVVCPVFDNGTAWVSH